MQNNLVITTLFCLLLAVNLCGQTSVSGIIDSDTRWTADKGPYLVEGDLIVLGRVRLVISPGTKILIPPHNKTPSENPFDRLDSTLISIRIKGALSCLGRRDNPIIFASTQPGFQTFNWRGIILDRAADQYTEIAFTEISGAATAVTVSNCSPMIRNVILENNNVGIHCIQGGTARIYNSILARNFSTGIKIESSNPIFLNNIIVFNRNLGMWCDGVSRVQFRYNCVYGNMDGNFLDCDPELGVISRVNKNSDSTDHEWNLYTDPVFSGSPAEKKAMLLDIDLQTEKSDIVDTSLAMVLYEELIDSVAPATYRGASHRYSLSQYSPCINAGIPRRRFNNTDGTPNTMGIQGGPEFMAE